MTPDMAEDVLAGLEAARHREDAAEGAPAARSPWQLAWTRLRRDRVAMVSLVVIVIVLLLAVFAPLVADVTHHGRDQQFRQTGLSPEGVPVGPGTTFLAGTDDLGRDVLVRTIYGARVSLIAGVGATLLAVAIGTAVGLAAGFLGRVTDTVLSRLIDVILAMPFVLTAAALVTRFHASLLLAILVIAFFSWAYVARIVRGQVLSIREREYVEAARSLGASSFRIMRVDVLPNVFAQVVVLASLLVPSAIVFEATLSFLGLGVPPPVPSWGGMISEAQQDPQAWWFYTCPGVFLLLTTLSFNLFGDGIRDAFDPRAGRS
jgi:ABC-type dipeptide/oligopeptide/nickel transport system permease subunit